MSSSIESNSSSSDSEDIEMGMGDAFTREPHQPHQEVAEEIPENSSCSKRLMTELNEVTMNPPPLCSAGLKSDNLYEWVATIIGPPNSVYEGGVFTLNFEFPKDYPFRPPKVTFKTRIYHCNVSSLGKICLDILNENWSPAQTVSSVLLSVCSLLSDCNPDDPLVASIAKLYCTNRKEHDRKAKECTRKYAFPEN